MSTPDLCCCCSLKTGGVIIGVLEILGGLLVIISSLLTGGLGLIVHQESSRGSGPEQADVYYVAIILLVIAGTWLIMGVVSIVLGIILLYAIRQESTYLMKIWIIFETILLIVIIACYVTSFAIAFNWFKFSMNFISVMFAVWFISVIYYHRKELKEQ